MAGHKKIFRKEIFYLIISTSGKKTRQVPPDREEPQESPGDPEQADFYYVREEPARPRSAGI